MGALHVLTGAQLQGTGVVIPRCGPARVWPPVRKEV